MEHSFSESRSYSRADRLRAAAACLLLAVAALPGCHDPDRYTLSSEESTAVEELFTLTVDGDSTLPADGFSSVRLVARILDVTEGSHAVLFSTSAGTLRVGNEVSVDTLGRSARALVPADPQGKAIVELVSSRQVATARVRAEIADVAPPLFQVRDIQFVPVEPERIVRFVDPPDSALANGLELVPLTVEIAPELQGDDRRVTFTTTQGTFAFAGEESQTRVIRADAAHRATVYLRGPDQVAEALVAATVRGFVQEARIRFVPVPAERVLRFQEAPESALADGVSLSLLSVEIAPELQGDEDRTVEFETTHGTFVRAADGDTRARVLADASNVSTVYLRSPAQIAEAVVTATIKGFVQKRTILFEWAGPDTIALTIEPDKLDLKANDQMDIEAEFIREEGRSRVTRDMEVHFSAADTLGERIERARFLNVTRIDSEGKASAVFAPDGTAYRGPVTITARPAKISTEVAGRIELRIVDP